MLIICCCKEKLFRFHLKEAIKCTSSSHLVTDSKLWVRNREHRVTDLQTCSQYARSQLLYEQRKSRKGWKGCRRRQETRLTLLFLRATTISSQGMCDFYASGCEPIIAARRSNSARHISEWDGRNVQLPRSASSL